LGSVVTADSLFVISVAKRLLKEESVQCQGQTLLLTDNVTEASRNDLSMTLDFNQPKCSSLLMKQHDALLCSNAISSSSNAESRDDILTNWWQPLDYNEQQSKQIGENVREDESLVHGDVCEKLDTSHVESSCEQLRQCVERSLAEEHRCQKLPFPHDKLRLLQKLITDSCLEFEADVRVKLDKCVVKISGRADDIEDTDMKLHELVASFTTARVDVSNAVAKLLSTKVGEDWLDARLERERLVAVFCLKDAVPVIMTDCQDRLTRVKHVIESSLVARRIPLEHHQTKLLQSSVWKECIDDLQSSRLLQISDADMTLVIEGCVDDAADAADKLDKMLEENSAISHAVKLRREIYQLMHFRSHEIQQDDR